MNTFLNVNPYLQLGLLAFLLLAWTEGRRWLWLASLGLALLNSLAFAVILILQNLVEDRSLTDQLRDLATLAVALLAVWAVVRAWTWFTLPLRGLPDRTEDWAPFKRSRTGCWYCPDLPGVPPDYLQVSGYHVLVTPCGEDSTLRYWSHISQRWFYGIGFSSSPSDVVAQGWLYGYPTQRPMAGRAEDIERAALLHEQGLTYGG